MCGIAAIFAYDNNAPPVDEAELLRVRERMIARGPDWADIEVARPAPARAMPFEAGLPFPLWMALARAAPVPWPEDAAQRWLGEPADDPAA